MKKTLFFFTALLLIAASASAQRPTYPQSPYCTGLKNPSNFTMTGGQSNSQWYGYTGSKNSIASTCSATGSTWTNTMIQASDLESYTNTNGCGSCSSEVSPGFETASKNIDNSNDWQRQFVIKGSGTDPETHGHLSYLPPDTSFHTSIRLGNYCGSHGAEKLYYEFNVNGSNAFVTLWYAMSLQNGQHSASDNPELVITVERQLPNGTWTLAMGDTLCRIITSPTTSGSDLSGTPFYVGSTGTQQGATYVSNIYLPWTKALINLYKLQYQRVRIMVASSDCSMTTHYGLSYIAGECQPMQLYANGCVSGDESIVGEITAPEGADSYVWYRSKTGILVGANQADMNNYELIPGATENVLPIMEGYFINTTTGDTMLQNTFLCQLTTSMNPTKPITTRLFCSVSNTKPRVRYHTVRQGNTMTVFDNSFTRYQAILPDDLVDTSLTQWSFYRSAQPDPSTLAFTATGGSVQFTVEDSTNYSMTMQVFKADTMCYSEKSFTLIDSFSDSTGSDPLPPFYVINGNELPAGTTAESLVNDLFAGGGVTVSNVQFNGDSIIGCNSIGKFGFSNSLNPIGMPSGLILSSGNVSEAYNTSASTYTNCSEYPNAALTALATSTLHGTATLEFDFVPKSDSIELRYIFASMEYPQYITGPYSDPMAIFLSGPKPANAGGGMYSNENLAILPNSNTAVGITTVNGNVNWQYYVNNSSHPYLRYGGYTIPMTAKAAVIPCVTYHLSIAIANEADQVMNSAILLDSGSFFSNAIEISVSGQSQQVGNSITITEGEEANILISRKRAKTIPTLISINYSGTATNGVDINYINPYISFPANETNQYIQIMPYDDGITEGSETAKFVFSPSDGCPMADSVEITITDNIIPCDTVFVYDTVVITELDSVYITEYDTITVTNYDTITVTYFDTITLTYFDTVTITNIDTVFIDDCDTVYLTDSVLVEHDYYDIVVTSENTSMGLAAGNGHFPEGTAVEIAAIPIEGNRFVSWNDGDASNPRTIVLTGNAAFYAIFSTTGVKEVTGAATWSLRGERGELIVEGAEGQLIRIYDLWGRLLTTIENASNVERYAVPVTGGYVVQVGNGPAKKINIKF